MKILSFLKYLLIIFIFIIHYPYFYIKLIVLKKRNKNDVINYLKNIKSYWVFKNINIRKLFKYLFLFNSLIVKHNNCLINNGIIFILLKKFVSPDINLIVGLKKDTNLFIGHCMLKYKNQILNSNDNNYEWTTIIEF
jgi:hypothetical protein